MFTDRVEQDDTQRSSEDIEKELVEKLKRLTG